MSGAIKPDFFSNFQSLEEKEDEKIGITDEERHLYRLNNHKGWKILRLHIENLVKELDSLNDLAYEKGLPLEEIGRNAVIVSLTKGIIKKVLNKVDDAKDAIENEDGTVK